MGGNQEQGLPTGISALVDAANVVAISTWDSHSAWVRSDGTVEVWTHGTGLEYRESLPPVELSNFVAVVPGPGYNLALLGDGSLRALGSNESRLRIPANVRDVVAISGGGWLCIGLRSDGSLLVLGDHPEVGREVAGIHDAVAVTAYLGWGTVRRSDGSADSPQPASRFPQANPRPHYPIK